MDKKFLQSVRELAILIVIGTIALVILNYTTDIFKKSTIEIKEKETIKEIVERPEKSSDYPDYNYFLSLKKLSLTTSTTSWVKKQNEELSIEGRTYKRFIKINGEIVTGYLYINASVDNGKPLTVWDSVYVSLRKVINNSLYQPLEGHLLRSNSLKIPSSDTTELLFDLRKIPMTTIPYSDDNSFIERNWLDLITGANKFQFETFLSTLRLGGEIIDISIAYECSIKTPDCELQLSDE